MCSAMCSIAGIGSRPGLKEVKFLLLYCLLNNVSLANTPK